MKFFDVHPADAHWLRRWLTSNLLCFSMIAGFALLIRLDPLTPPQSMKRSVAGPIDHSLPPSSSTLPPETELVLLNSRPPNPIAPQGWRRTADGWELASEWTLPRPLGEIIQEQQEREPIWMQFALATLRDVPPLVFAMLQISMVIGIIHTAGPLQNRGAPLKNSLAFAEAQV